MEDDAIQFFQLLLMKNQNFHFIPLFGADLMVIEMLVRNYCAHIMVYQPTISQWRVFLIDVRNLNNLVLISNKQREGKNQDCAEYEQVLKKYK